MNNYTAINVSYLRPSRSIETILLKNNTEERVIYVYNFEGIHFYIFNFITDLLDYFDDGIAPPVSFETEVELGKYLANLNLGRTPNASSIIKE